MDVASVRAGLRGHVRHAVAADHIAPQVVSLRERELQLGPAGHIVASPSDLEWEVPDHASVGLLGLVGVLAHATFVALSEKMNNSG